MLYLILRTVMGDLYWAMLVMLLLLQSHMISEEQANRKKVVRIVAMSDTHDEHYKIDIAALPPADIFIHAGDFTCKSTADELQRFRQFLKELPYKHKIVIAGNHDFALDELTYQSKNRDAKHKDCPLVSKEEVQKMREVCTFLIHEMVEVKGLKIFGSPFSPKFIGKWGFTYKQRDSEKLFSYIPNDIDVLVTHGPPAGILDYSKYFFRQGCKGLLNAVQRVRPKVHIFGHIHEDYGQIVVGTTRFYNAASKRSGSMRLNPPHIIDIQTR